MDKHFDIDHTADYIHIAFNHPHRVLSSAVLNGGLVEADHIVNLKVPKDLPDRDTLGPPADFIERHCRGKNLIGTCVGMMTAASMNSMRATRQTDLDVDIMAIVTAGLSNLRRAGDKADYREQVGSHSAPTPGTINTVVLTNIALSKAGMVEAIMIAAEAKAAALQNNHLMSPVSNTIATGTGTDAIAIACAPLGLKLNYAGKHTRFGELLAKSVIESTTASVLYDSHKGK